MALNQSGCRNSTYFHPSLFEAWKNYSTFNSSLDLEEYICDYKKYAEFSNKFHYMIACMSVSCSAMGICSCFLTLATLWSNKQFSSRSFLYFRLISCLELFNMMYILMGGIQNIFTTQYASSYSWFWFMTTIGGNIGNLCGTWVDFVTIFLSVERAVACLAPKKFHAINKLSVAVIVIMISGLLSACLFLPQCFSKNVVRDPTSGTYASTTSEIGQHPIYEFYSYCLDMFWFFVAACVIVTSVLVLVGMMRSLKVKRGLRKVAPIQAIPEAVGGGFRRMSMKISSTKANQANADTTKLNLQLCYLQVSQALPTAINYVLYSALLLVYSSLTTGYLAVSSGIGYESAQQYLKDAYSYQYLRLFVGLTNDLAHCFHFYLYIAFSRRFRNAFCKRFLNKNSDDPGAANGMTIYNLSPMSIAAPGVGVRRY